MFYALTSLNVCRCSEGGPGERGGGRDVPELLAHRQGDLRSGGPQLYTLSKQEQEEALGTVLQNKTCTWKPSLWE